MADTDDLKPLLMKLLDIAEKTARDVVDIRAELKVMNTRLDGFEKRLDDQGRILAALVPTRIAAVPPPAAE
ncbi:MAG TPA: hypothetical protein VD860_09560 [Azospirillum sp.]|nr:hypothetical protein [Azospirillum sp.]